MDYSRILKIPPFSLGRAEKEKLLTGRLLGLTEHHRLNCPEYRRMLEASGYDGTAAASYRDIPFLPVRMFKELSLKSVADGEVVKTVTSSGTTGQAVSKIFLDRTTAANQQKTMAKIVSDFTGTDRMPMIILDCPSVVKDRRMFSARGAGILGFSVFGSRRVYALDDDMKLDVEGLEEFLGQHRGERILLFGFTFMVWQHFYKELVRLKGEGITFDLSEGVLIHGGGWKKLVNEAVGPEEFHASLREACGLDDIHDYYGMVEQTGCIYMQCEYGHLHASIFSDVVMRNPLDFSECGIGEKGIIQVLSAIPESYPGHSLLTEDEGILLGEDDCPCGRKGKYFRVLGRLKDAEIRGCSDTYAAGFRAVGETTREKAGTYLAGTQTGSGTADRGQGEKKPDVEPDRTLDALSSVRFLVGSAQTVRQMPSLSPWEPFDGRVLEFLDGVSGNLMADREARAYPDVVTFAFWIRKANTRRLEGRFARDAGNGNIRLGRGTAFHIAPSNVPVNYAYSLAAGLLAGNANIVRIPSKDFPQVGLVNRALRSALERYPYMEPYICLVRYGRDRAVNDLFSSIADVRVVWGGDATVAELRRSPLGSRAGEITFADRFSVAVVDSDAYMDLLDSGKGKAAEGFYNDTYLTDQNACTSPRLVAWLGGRKEEAKTEFWGRLHRLTERKYGFQPIQGVDKLADSYRAAAVTDGIRIEGHADNLLVRVRVETAPAALMDYKGNSGYFFEYDCGNILELRELCDDRRCQTVAYIGDRTALLPLVRSGVKGVDRIVPVGKTMDFDLLWDGYDLMERMTRTMTIE